jgi:hypothetical protein
MPDSGGGLRRTTAVPSLHVRAEKGGEANPSMSPPGLMTGLLLCFPDSLPRPPRLATAVVLAASRTAKSSPRPEVFGDANHRCTSRPCAGRWQRACATPRSTGLAAARVSALRRHARRSCLSVAPAGRAANSATGREAEHCREPRPKGRALHSKPCQRPAHVLEPLLERWHRAKSRFAPGPAQVFYVIWRKPVPHQ